MTNEDRARLKSKLAPLFPLLADAVAIVEDVRETSRGIEGGCDELVFYPLTVPTAERPGTDYSAYLARVAAVLGEF